MHTSLARSQMLPPDLLFGNRSLELHTFVQEMVVLCGERCLLDPWKAEESGQTAGQAAWSERRHVIDPALARLQLACMT